jgi:hypothetical protein
MQAIVICTVNNPGITVLLESIRCYGDKLPVYLCSNNLGLWARAREITDNLIYRPNPATNFGDAYNAAIDYAFEHGKFDSLILANDDVVLNPNTLSLMREDTEVLRERGFKVGFLGARSDYVLPDQNIRFPVDGDRRSSLAWESEQQIKVAPVIAPIWASISREAWNVAKFPSTNWYSDNIICHDLNVAGYQHFVSRAYVHHAGSQTIGVDFKKSHEEPRAWIMENRPDMYELIYG